MNFNRIARRVERAWYTPGAALIWLQPLAWLFGAVTAVRRQAYRVGWLPSYAVGVPVIVIGNITVGGTGKTPFVEWLCGFLLAEGRRPGIVSRGYGGRTSDQPRLVDRAATAEDVGDEPVLLARRTGVPVCVGADRVAAARALVEQGVDVLVADDGLQHYRLRRDYEIVILDADRRLGNGRLLPAGPLREPESRLQRADLVLFNGESRQPGEPGFRLVPGQAVNLATGEQRPLEGFSGQRVWAIAGIGNPARFHSLLAAAGMQVDIAAVADHARLDLDSLAESRQQPLLMTEKDAVKYLGNNTKNTWYVPVKTELSQSSTSAIRAGLAALLEAPAGVGR